MSTLSPIPQTAPDTAASTASAPPAGRRGRILGWTIVIVLVLGVVLLTTRLPMIGADMSGTLSPSNPGPSGAKALAELARDQGVDITETRSRVEAASMLGPDATLVLTDPYTLSDDGVRTLLERADRVVLLTSSARMLRLLKLGTDAWDGGAEVEASCSVPEFARVGGIEPQRAFVPARGVDGCFGDDSSAVLRSTADGRTITLVEGTELFSNGHLAENGNAALGLALIAQQPQVVWYVPDFADSDISSAQKTLGDLSPGWLTPAILLLMLAGVAAIWWRGRRFGPLVAEALPVTVRASETMQGRARLTAKAADAPHAGSAIRSGTLSRLAARLALGPRSRVEEVADAASDRLGVPRTALYDLLGGQAPQDDRELVELARRLSELETAVEQSIHAARTERNRS
ncbi:DUF4350 domain-containing protein [uncultured Microbacterium sp.]|uniref:DUF4350 domain-containing protein n=1 Tax=uncultured Microbacterium sp. TaxID=191216 RepID=UPI00260ACB71|nr:DUF4350 domain-containing protein [uncultured Microbacterium sp.]